MKKINSKRLTIGVACILPEDITNEIRLLELKIAQKTQNFRGMCQPPNVTIKRPFDVKSVKKLTEFTNLLEQTVKIHKPLEITYTGTGNFANSVLYIGVRSTKTLRQLHEELRNLAAQFDATTDEFEGESVIFHTSIAMGLQELELAQSTELASGSPLITKKFTCNKIAVLLQTENFGWITITTISL